MSRLKVSVFAVMVAAVLLSLPAAYSQVPSVPGEEGPPPEQPAGSSGSESPRNPAPYAVSVHPLALIFGTIEVSVSREFSPLFTLELSPFYHSSGFGYSPGTGAVGTAFDWYGARADALFFIGRKQSDGLFVGGGAAPGMLRVPMNGVEWISLSIGAFAGYRFMFGRYSASPRVIWSLSFPFGTGTDAFPLKGVILSGDIAFSRHF